MNDYAKQFLKNVKLSESKGLVFTGGGGGPLEGFKKLLRAIRQLEKAKAITFIGDWEGGFAVTPKALRKYGRQLLEEHFKLFEMFEYYANDLSAKDVEELPSFPVPVTEKALREQVRKVEALEKQRGVEVIHDWDVNVEEYDPSNVTHRRQVKRDNHRPSIVRAFLRN